MPELQVLVVDDNPVLREACVALLLLWGIEPAVACDGAEALGLFQARRFDLVLMDISMPVMDGFSATYEIRRLEQGKPSSSRVPVIAYSSAEVSAERLRKVGFSAALQKPADAWTMGQCLRRWCGEKFLAKRPQRP